MTSTDSNINKSIDKIFRQSYGKLVSALLSKFGTQYLDIAENAIMEAYYRALKVWPYKGTPDNPSGWLYRAAYNVLIDTIRKEKRISTDEIKEHVGLEENVDFDETIVDPELKLLFMICHPALSKDEQLVFMLKTLSGLGDHEISHALMEKKSTIKKRLQRSKSWIREKQLKFDWPSESELKNRIGMVHKALYLLFNEGFYSSHPEHWVRKDLCLESMRLCKYLVEHPIANNETHALMSLMCYHISRYESRVDEEGKLVLLNDQDRTKWNSYFIKLGSYYLQQSAKISKEKSRYQVEAYISAQHCIAKDFESTNWKLIRELYEALYRNYKEELIVLNLVLVNIHLNEIKIAQEYFLSIDIDKFKGNKATYFMIGVKLYEQLKDQMQIELMLEQAIQASEGTKQSSYLKSMFNKLKEK